MTNKTDFELVLQNLKDKLFDEEIVKTYFSLKEQIKNNKELQELEASIKNNAKIMTKNMDNDEIYFAAKEKYELQKEVYDNHPLVINFKSVSKEVNEILQKLKSIIE